MYFGLTIDVESLRQRLGDANLVIFDCRFDLASPSKGLKSYGEAHLPGALYAHLDHHLAGPTGPDTGRHPLPRPEHFFRWLGECGVSRDSQIVVYDDSGGSIAARLWWLLKWIGHDAAAVLDGGWRAWLDRGHPVSSARQKPSPAHLRGRPNDSMVVSTDHVMDSLTSGNLVVLDVRARQRFRGEQEPLDPVAGHIPGARNIPFGDNLDEHGFFLHGDVLRELYIKLLGDISPNRVAFMCGSGVTACHGILAMELAGLSGARLYAGSWSEWIRDPGHPLAMGP